METREEALQLLSSVHEGSLATMDASGEPFVSAVGFITEGEKIFILMSDLARHTKHLIQNPKASLLIVEQNTKLPIHEKKRASLSGLVLRVQDQTAFEKLKQNYLKAFPKANIFFTLPDFRFYEFQISEIYWIGGFGKAESIKLR